MIHVRLLNFASILSSLVILAACGTAPAAPPTPTPIAHNADWTPVTQTINGVTMVEVPAGCFMMGSDTGRREVRPANRECVGSFWIDRTDVTNQAFGSDGAFPGANVPHGNLTWFDANTFCQKRGARLPTEAEWEYAARGPDSLIYPWGNTFDASRLAYDQNMVNYVPLDVGSKPTGASWVGALDMSGEVFQWVHSIFKPYPYSATDGRESDTDTAAMRVYRGGWESYIDNAMSGFNRLRMSPDGRDWHIGFRCALTR